MALPKEIEDLENMVNHAINTMRVMTEQSPETAPIDPDHPKIQELLRRLNHATENFAATMASRQTAADLGVTGPGEPQKSQQGVNEYDHSGTGAPARTVQTTQGPVETNPAERDAKMAASPPVGDSGTAARRR